MKKKIALGLMVTAIGVLAGLICGFMTPIIPYKYARYTAVAILAAVDSVIGGATAITNKKFDMGIFVSGFFTNAFLAIVLTLLGENLDLDIYLAAVFVFVYRMFNNLAIIRRYVIEKLREFQEEKKKAQVEEEKIKQ